MKCKNCGKDLPESAKFCLECGEKVEQELVCPSCGTILPLDAKFCLECGASMVKLNKEDIEKIAFANESFEREAIDDGSAPVQGFVKVSSLEIGESESGTWKEKGGQGSIKNSYIAPYSGNAHAASSGRYIVISAKDGLCIVDRNSSMSLVNGEVFNGLNYQIITPTGKKGFKYKQSIGGCAIVDDTFYWSGQSQEIYSMDLHTMEANVFYAITQGDGCIRSLQKFEDGLCFIYTQYDDEQRSDSLCIRPISGRGPKPIPVPEKCGICNIVWAGCGYILLRDLSGDYTEYWIYDTREKEFLALHEFLETEDECFWNDHYDIEEKKNLLDKNLYTFNFGNNYEEVVFYNFPEIHKHKYQADAYRHDALISFTMKSCIGPVERDEEDDIKRSKANANKHILYLSAEYKDRFGHEVFLEDCPDGIYLSYRKMDDTVQHLFEIVGACSESFFQMLDYHTAITIVHNTDVAIVDFLSDSMYLIESISL